MWDPAPLLSPAATWWLRLCQGACEDPGVLALGQPQGLLISIWGRFPPSPKLFWLDHHGVFVTLCHPVPHPSLAGPVCHRRQALVQTSPPRGPVCNEYSAEGLETL